MKAIIFASASDRIEDSKDASLMRISKYVASKGLTEWKTYVIKESSTRRKQLQEVLRDIRSSREPVALVVDTVARLPRSFRELVLLDDLRRAGKLHIHFYREDLVINQGSDGADLLRWDMAVVFTRNYVLQKSSDVKRRREQLLRSGIWPHRPPLGYVNLYDERGKWTNLAPDPRISQLIQKAFRTYAAGHCSLRAIADMLRGEGLRSAAGNRVLPRAIDRMLLNPFYCGEMQANGTRYPHRYKRLITKRLFNKCQKIRESRNEEDHRDVP